MRVNQRTLENNQIRKVGLAVGLIGIVMTFAGIYISRSQEVGFAQTNQEIVQGVRREYEKLDKIPMKALYP